MDDNFVGVPPYFRKPSHVQSTKSLLSQRPLFRLPHVCRAVQTGMAGRILLVPKEFPDRVLDKCDTYGILPSRMVD